MADPAPTTDPNPNPEGSPRNPKPNPADEPLGDSGKKALESERDARKAAEARAREFEADAKRAKDLDAEIATLRAAQMSDQEKAIADAKKTAETEADQRWSERILKAEAKAAASGKVVDADTAVRLLDLSKIPIKDGDVDTAALNKAIDDLVEAKPFLKPAEPAGNGRQATFPQGARGDGKGSITREQLKTMRPEEIDAAHKKGELDHLFKG